MSADLVNQAPPIWSYVSEFLKLVPGLVLLPISFVVGWKKIGHKAVISYYETHEQFQAQRLTKIVLTNLKDKPLVVHALYADVDHHALIKIKVFDIPLVIKGLESAVIETDPVSSYLIGQVPYDPVLFNIEAVYVITTGKRFRCKIDNTPSIQAIAKGDQYQEITTMTYQYFGLTFNEQARYGLNFKIGTEQYVALVHTSGFIGTGWPFSANMLLPENMVSPEAVKKSLDNTYREVYGDSLLVHELNTKIGNPFVSFKKV